MSQLVLTVSSWVDVTLFVDYIKYLKMRYKVYLGYKQTIAELSSMTDHELSDIGINRSMIRSVANEYYVEANKNLRGWV